MKSYTHIRRHLLPHHLRHPWEFKQGGGGGGEEGEGGGAEDGAGGPLEGRPEGEGEQLREEGFDNSHTPVQTGDMV